MTFQILGIGTAVPEHVMTQAEALAMSAELICRNPRETRLLRMMFRHAGIDKRHTCVPHRDAYDWVGERRSAGMAPGRTTGERMRLYATHAGPLAARAADQALVAAEVDATEITHLVTVSCTGFEAPGIGVQLIEELGLPATTEQLHIGYMGCHGAMNGMRAARGLLALEPAAKILLCAVELCSLHYRLQWDAERVGGNALFADGAAGLVGGIREGEHPALAATGSCLLGHSRDSMTWRIGDFGFEMTLSRDVPRLIRRQLRPWLVKWLAKHGESLDSMGGWAVHPGGPRILEAVELALGLPDDALAVSREVLAQYGNMSSPTVLFVLDELVARAVPRPYVALGFGPGLTVEASLIR